MAKRCGLKKRYCPAKKTIDACPLYLEECPKFGGGDDNPLNRRRKKFLIATTTTLNNAESGIEY
jgi:hypothetical protein